MARLLHEGKVGPGVRELQFRLNRAVPKVPKLKEDSIFGPKTKASLIAFQKAHGLKPDGLYGPNSSAVLAANHVIAGAPLRTPGVLTEWSRTKVSPYIPGGG